MEAKLLELSKTLGGEVVSGDAEFHEPDIRSGIVTCAALSLDGCCVALGFGSGVIEVADIDHQRTISRFQCSPTNLPVWIEFYGDNNWIVTEDSSGNITILESGMQPQTVGILSGGPRPAVTAVSDNGNFVVRVPRNLHYDWYEEMALLDVSVQPSIRYLASPSSGGPPEFRPSSAAPLRRMLGFSPGSRYIGAYGRNHAFVWSTDSCQLIAQYAVPDFTTWALNTGITPPSSYLVPNPIVAPCIPDSVSDPSHDSDEPWLRCPFYDLSPDMQHKSTRNEVYSSAVGRIPLVTASHTVSALWFNGKVKLILPEVYRPIVRNPRNIGTEEIWYGDQMFDDDEEHDEKGRSEDDDEEREGVVAVMMMVLVYFIFLGPAGTELGSGLHESSDC
ncbi:uncharacterized protein EI90DRAFT_3076569 [Cantharellus anzutake]|uniref:uncharacterized protein n=1 Tax=Cantharellus anzutake TaxID=1750568 RepID=UPI00190664ED|nr:uncharacterized protein EI90DRAFT_3076569 [Cantharellus anzutake]KAF8323611.1 hypothetical protein EI90DRAFT_3076569 [Cantharellus anzutake]